MADLLFTVQDLEKVFPDGTRALAGINLDIRVGDTLVIAGSNGSGKTQLMRLLVGLTEPSGGQVLFYGRNIKGDVAAVRRSVGLVFQDADAQIIGETVAEDVAFGPNNLGLSKAEVQERVDDALDRLGLSEKRLSHPRRLSGGEKRRLAVAGILAMGCEAVIMDEPFANLDWPGVVQVLELVKQLKSAGKTILVLTHELEKVLAFADTLVILHQGVVRDQGDPAAVLDRLDPAYGVRDPRRCYAGVQDCTWLG